ncbi:MAG: hypothetical protein HY898_14265 [Deltaproteobacteria bacterium]|nr:hypothetical protein [Deltaproteobacteria bacterium]
MIAPRSGSTFRLCVLGGPDYKTGVPVDIGAMSGFGVGMVVAKGYG